MNPNSKKDAKVLSKIFDLLKKSKKKGNKRPVQPTGSPNSSDQFASLLASLSGKPAELIAKQFEGGLLEGTLNIEFSKFQLSKDYVGANRDPNVGRFRVRSGEIADALLDPQGFLDGIEKKIKEDKKASRLVRFAETLDSVAATYAAYQSGMGISDAITMGLSSQSEYDYRAVEKEKKLVIESAVLESNYEKAYNDVLVNNPSLEPDSQDFRNRLRQNLDSRKDAIDKQVDKVHKYFERDSRYSGRGFRDVNVKFGNPKAAWIDYGEDGVVDYSHSEGIKITDNIKNDLDDLLSGTVEPEVFEGIVNALEKETNGPQNLGMVSYRDNQANNLLARALYAGDQADYENLIQQASFVSAISRVKAPNAISGRTQTSSEDPSSALDSLLQPVTGKPRDEIQIDDLDPWVKNHIVDLDNALSQATDSGVINQLTAKRDALWASGLDIIEIRREFQKDIYSKGESTLEVLGKGDYKFYQDYRDNVLEAEILAAEAGAINPINNLGKQDLYSKKALGLRRYQDGQKPIPLLTFANNIGAVSGIYNEIQNFDILDPLTYFGYDNVSPGRFGDDEIFYGTDYEKGYEERSRKSVEASFIVSRGNEGARGKINPYLANLYYLTPQSIVKNFLVDGSTFVYGASRTQNRILSDLSNNSDVLLSALTSKIGSEEDVLLKFGYDVTHPDFKASDFFKDGKIVNGDFLKQNYAAALAYLRDNRNGLSPETVRLLEKNLIRLRQVQGLGKAANFIQYSPINLANKTIEKVRDLFKSVVFENKYALKAKKFLLEKFFTNNPQAKRAFARFLAGEVGVTQVFTKLIGTAVKRLLASVIGTVTGPVGLVVTYVVTWVAEKLAFKTLKTSLVIILTLITCTCGMLLAVLGAGFNAIGSSSIPAQNRRPGNVIACTEGFVDPELGGNTPPASGQVPEDSICPFRRSSLICTQGPRGGFSHERLNQVYGGRFPIDLSAAAGIYYAPESGTVTHKRSFCPQSFGGNGEYIGDTVTFRGDSGTTYRLLHINSLVNNGARVQQGEAIATPGFNVPTSRCFTGAHYHLEVRTSGFVNAKDWYTDLGCNIQGC